MVGEEGRWKYDKENGRRERERDENIIQKMI